MDTPEESDSTKTEKQIEIDKMRNALMSIASEMQRYQESDQQLDSCEFGLPDSNEGEKVLSELLKCKTKIKCKKQCIRKLQKNLKTACFVAKTIASAKEDESGSLKQHLDDAQSECAKLKEKEKKNMQLISSLSRENNTLHDKFNRVASFIRLGYKELQKMRHELTEEPSVLVQLRKLIVSCGEYYANYCNEHDKCLHLKQRNRFLDNKISFLEKYIKTLSEQIKILKYRNLGLQKDNDLTKIRSDKSKTCNINNNVEVAYAEVKMKLKGRDNARNEVKYRRTSELKRKLGSQHEFDLSPHLSIVKKLLTDQDTLLKDLKTLSQEFSNSCDRKQIADDE